MRQPVEIETLYQNSVETPIGQVYLAGFINKSGSRTFQQKRVLGRYPIVYIVEGSGIYWDANRVSRDVSAGDMLILFPELAHSYGARKHENWSELFVVFDGPVFDLCRETGLLNAETPVQRLEPIDEWHARLRAVINPGESPQTEFAGRAQDAIRLLAFLTEALAASWQVQQHGLITDPLIRKACEILGANLGVPVDLRVVAAELNLGYESFRKHFQAAMSVAPGRYRLKKRLDAAASLLRHTQLSNAEIAENLGFSDAFHFGRQFKTETGSTPRQYRRNSSSG